MTGHPVLVYDGNCPFCTAVAHRIAMHWREPARAVAWQSLGDRGLADLGLTAGQTRQAAWWIDPDGRRSRGHAAVGRALLAAGGWRAVVGRLTLTRPTSWLAAATYAAVVRSRAHLPVPRDPGGAAAD